MDNYEVYRSDETDVNYTGDRYNFRDHSITLLRNKKPIHFTNEIVKTNAKHTQRPHERDHLPNVVQKHPT